MLLSSRLEGMLERMRVLVSGALVAGVLAVHAAASAQPALEQGAPERVEESVEASDPGSAGVQERDSVEPGYPAERAADTGRSATPDPGPTTPAPTQPAPGAAPLPGSPASPPSQPGPGAAPSPGTPTPPPLQPAPDVAPVPGSPASPPTQPGPGVAPLPGGLGPAPANTPLARLQALAADVSAEPDLAEAALLAAQLAQPVDTQAYLAKIDALAAEFEPLIGNRGQTLEVAGRLARFLYQEKAFANSAVQSAEIFVGLDQVLDKKQWNCVGMALLYAAIGKRTGLPLQLVAGHGHVLVAYNAPPYFFIETTARGGLQPSRDYLTEYLPFPCVSPARYVVLNNREAIAMTLTQMGLAMQGAQRAQLAGTLFSLAIDFSETYAEAWAGRGFLRAAEGNAQGAMADFERAIDLDPELREAYGGLGAAYREQGNLPRAVETYRTLLALCPEDSVAVFNTGQLLYESGDLQGSVQAFRQYIDLEPRDPEGYMRIAFPLEDAGDLAGAAEAYQRVLALAPNTPDAILNLSYIYEQIRDFNSSMEGYRRVLALQPANVRAAGGVARVLGKTGRYEDALRTFRAALESYPNTAFLWVDLGQLLEYGGDLKQAIGAYQEAVRVNPSDPESYYALARALQRAGLANDAQHVLAQARAVEAARSSGQALQGGWAPPATSEGGIADLFPGGAGAPLELPAPEIEGAPPGAEPDIQPPPEGAPAPEDNADPAAPAAPPEAGADAGPAPEGGGEAPESPAGPES